VLGPAFDLGLALADEVKGKTKKENRTQIVNATVAGGAAFAIGYLPQLLAYKALTESSGPRRW
jgi:hypothetical protein